jgi:hypothetical protein
MSKRKDKEESARHSLDFGKKEKVLNYTCQTYQLSRPNKVGAVMSLIRQCQPQTFTEWEKWYFDNALTDGKQPGKITEDTLIELGERLYRQVTERVIPEWTTAFNDLTHDDCIAYIRNLTINRTYDGYIREKSIIHDGLAKIFPNILFEESPPELDHAGDVDYLGFVDDTGGKAFGIQIKPVTARTSFGNYSPSERMRNSFADFEAEFGGKVFIVFSLNKTISNPDIIPQIAAEITRLRLR